MVRVRYVGRVRVFCEGRGTVRWYALWIKNQRWSRGHKARGQGQGHKKIRGQGQGQPFWGQNLSRPRTGMLESKAKDQGHRRKRSPKKRFSKFFFRWSTIHWRTQNFWLGRPKPQITWNYVIKIFPKTKYLWDKAFVGWKIWNRCCLFARNKDFAKEEGLN